MDVKNLVLELGESESAQSVQARLDAAGTDGFFLVNVVGRLAFLRTSVTQKKPESVPAPEALNADAVASIRKAIGSRERITLRELRRVGRFAAFPEKAWYRALQSLVEDGAIVLREESSARGYAHTVVLPKKAL